MSPRFRLITAMSVYFVVVVMIIVVVAVVILSFFPSLLLYQGVIGKGVKGILNRLSLKSQIKP